LRWATSRRRSTTRPRGEELTLNPGSLQDETSGSYPYFTDYVKTLLQSDFDNDTILKGGLRVYTTLDPTYQEAAEEAVSTTLDSANNDRLSAALVCIDNDTGYVKAMVGGRDYSSSQFNLATQSTRQAGSSFKTFTLTAAISAGMNPNITLNCSSPMQITSTWTVKNYGNHQYGYRSLASATAISSNTAYAQVAEGHWRRCHRRHRLLDGHYLHALALPVHHAWRRECLAA
jgi:membrane peptidoglycan carboxypeptidase